MDQEALLSALTLMLMAARPAYTYGEARRYIEAGVNPQAETVVKAIEDEAYDIDDDSLLNDFARLVKRSYLGVSLSYSKDEENEPGYTLTRARYCSPVYLSLRELLIREVRE